MNVWNLFPLNAAIAIQSRMHRRRSLDSIRIEAEQKMANDGYIENLGEWQHRILEAALEGAD